MLSLVPPPKRQSRGISLRGASDRIRILSAVERRGPLFEVRRVIVITLSLVVLLIPPLLGWVRIDLWGGNHLLLGEPANVIAALKGFVVAMGVLYGFTFASNVIVGRFFCGWGCPVGYVSRLGEHIALAKSKAARWWHQLSGAGFAATFVAAVMLWWVDPRVMIEGSLKAKLIVAGVFIALWIGGWLHASKWRFGFCLSACPIGFYYRIVTSKAPIGISFIQVPNPCIECHACEKVCPVNLDPKRLGDDVDAPPDTVDGPSLRYGDAECLRCGDCVEACRMVFAPDPGAVPPLRFGFERTTKEV